MGKIVNILSRYSTTKKSLTLIRELYNQAYVALFETNLASDKFAAKDPLLKAARHISEDNCYRIDFKAFFHGRTYCNPKDFVSIIFDEFANDYIGTRELAMASEVVFGYIAKYISTVKIDMDNAENEFIAEYSVYANSLDGLIKSIISDITVRDTLMHFVLEDDSCLEETSDEEFS